MNGRAVKYINIVFIMLLMLIVFLAGCAHQAELKQPVAVANAYVGSTSSADKNPATRQYTFAWNYLEGGALAPHGGTTKGVPVALDTQPSAAWLRLREAHITDFERDRRAILAMAGEYKTTFDFIEVAGFTPNYKPQAPYQTWATEKVVVLENKCNFISLQHILVSRTIGADGKVSAPEITKHWRQDWQYQPTSVLTYRGNNVWQKREVSDEQSEGAWSQSVYQVDDSPRYADVAKWQHFGNYSSWSSQDVWQPLPRREYTQRHDYQVLVGSNRQIILLTGWVHEQQNNKVMLDANGQASADAPVIAREIGFNLYERIKGFDFKQADLYLKNIAPFWHAVRTQWTALSQQDAPIKLRAAPDQGFLYVPLFEYADGLNHGNKPTPAEMEAYAQNAVAGYLSKPASTAAK